jgi:2-dehydropantoate 2-reductase
MSQRRYVVIGGGAVGGVVAAQLSLHGHPVVLVPRGEHGKRIAADGLLVRRPTGADVVKLDVAAGPAGVQLRGDDTLVLAVKTQDSESTVAEWAWQPVYNAAGHGVGTAAELPILTLQNGRATEDNALRRFRRVYGTTVAIAASFLSPGEVVSPSVDPVGVFWIGRYPGGSDHLQEEIVADFNHSALGAFSVTDIQATKGRQAAWQYPVQQRRPTRGVRGRQDGRAGAHPRRGTVPAAVPSRPLRRGQSRNGIVTFIAAGRRSLVRTTIIEPGGRSWSPRPAS